MNNREASKAKTRQKAIDAARKLWGPAGGYDAHGIRDICAEMGMTIGAMFNSFTSKADLWRATFDCEPPVDSAMTRAAPALLDALKGSIGALQFSVDFHDDLPADEQAFAKSRLDAALDAIAKAEGAQ